ncbi:MAG: XapX domain-containing protein [Bacillota bacterium]
MSPLALRDVALATVTGIVAGFAFGKLRLPVPAPPTLAGVLGIVGMTIGYALARRF